MSAPHSYLHELPIPACTGCHMSQNQSFAPDIYTPLQIYIYTTPDIYTPLQIYIPHSRYIYPTPDIYTPLQIYIPHSRYTPLKILYPTPSGAGIIYLERGIYIWSGVYISGVGYSRPSHIRTSFIRSPGLSESRKVTLLGRDRHTHELNIR